MEWMTIARGLLALYFSVMELAGKSEEEKEAMYKEEEAKFKENKPENLTSFDVPDA